MSIVYLRAEKIDALILISFNQEKNSSKVILNEIKFFKHKKNLFNYTRRKDLKVVEQPNHPAPIRDLISQINAYLYGKKLNLIKNIENLNIELQLEEKFSTDFSYRVITFLINNINYGTLTSYSEIGKNLGTKAYRAIGTVLKKNPLPLIIPCHRVIKKNGDIGGFMGKTDQDWEQNIKKKLLSIEKKISV